jgi:Na+/proline symporter
MGLGVSIFLIAVGAVLAFAIHVTTSGVDLHTIGYILMGVGALGIVLSLIFWSSWGGPAGVRRTDVTTVDERRL